MSREQGKLGLFAEAMQRELDANEHKGGWGDVDQRVLVNDVAYHVLKLMRALRTGPATRVLEHAADVANCAMIVADSAGVLNVATRLARLAEPDFAEPIDDSGAEGIGGFMTEAATIVDPRKERLAA